METKVKGMRVGVLRNDWIGDCTNGGITSRLNCLILVGEGIPEISEAEEGNYLILRKVADRVYAVPPEGSGWMMGGNHIYTSDSRFRQICPYPIPVHDRQEGKRLVKTEDKKSLLASLMSLQTSIAMTLQVTAIPDGQENEMLQNYRKSLIEQINNVGVNLEEIQNFTLRYNTLFDKLRL